MKDIDYTKALEILQDILKRAKPLQKEFTERIAAAYGQENIKNFANPAAVMDFLQVYIEKPSEGAKLSFETKDAMFYIYEFDGTEISECVRKDAE